jgi:hypothetical protein
MGCKKAYRINAINLARHHRKHCEGENCNISLILLMEMAKESGVKFTDEEIKEFL